MRQVNRDEFAYAIASALRKVSPTLRKQLATGIPAMETKARAMIALNLADELARYEILTDAPEAFGGEDSFTRPLQNMIGDGRL